MYDFVYSYFGKDQVQSIQPLEKAGSDRQYARIYTQGLTYIFCKNDNPEENRSFIYFSNYFREYDIPLPKVLAINENGTEYIQDDLGNQSLLNLTLEKGYTSEVLELYKSCLFHLSKMQTVAANQLDFSQCFANKEFDKQAILADLNYFKYYFLDLQKITYSKSELQHEFELFADNLSKAEPRGFMYRDFQGRNIMLHHQQPYFIDFQGGMKGPCQYDVASLLWQAKANLPIAWKKELFDYYIQCIKTHINIQPEAFSNVYSQLVLLRLLQVLGAYGLRGIIEKRPHFIASIPYGLENLSSWLLLFNADEFPVLKSIIQQLSQAEFISKFKQNMPPQSNHLKVLIHSFSYKKGLPKDESGNGGGFVFDCRGVLNPGRFEEYKKLTGRDQPVIDFLESKTRIHEFIQSAKDIVSISVEDYINRGFEHLQINFGCTGGQHRSVYCADAMGKYLKEKYNVEVTVVHIVQEAKGWIN